MRCGVCRADVDPTLGRVVLRLLHRCDPVCALCRQLASANVLAKLRLPPSARVPSEPGFCARRSRGVAS